MSKVKIKLDDGGIQSLLKGSEMQSILANIAQERATQAGEGYNAEVHVFQKRAVAHVFPTTYQAMRDNYDHNTLLKVVGV